MGCCCHAFPLYLLSPLLAPFGLLAAARGGKLRPQVQAMDVLTTPFPPSAPQIQALDLLGRKVMLGKLKPITEHSMGL